MTTSAAVEPIASAWAALTSRSPLRSRECRRIQTIM